MSRMTSKRKQTIIDGYLNATGRNTFIAHEFIDWLAGQPDHEAYDLFYGMDDEAAAREHRIALARSFVSGLRIKVQQSEAPAKGKTLRVVERTYPAFISPMEGRKAGGGYVSTDPANVDHMAEVRRQGATAMASWLERYGDAFADCDLSTLEEIAGMPSSGVVVAAE